MNLFDRLLEVPITIVLIVGGYQFYFWAQRQTFFEPSYLTTRFDAKIKYDPRWVWMYAGLYYPMMVLAAMSQDSWRAFAISIGGFLLLLFFQMYFFIFHPVAIPADWRTDIAVIAAGIKYPRSQHFMDLVWSYDKLRNSMPSMHVSVATMIDLTISDSWHWFAWVGWLFPVLISVSALKTKQHYVVDIAPGMLMGVVVYWLWQLLFVAPNLSTG